MKFITTTILLTCFLSAESQILNSDFGTKGYLISNAKQSSGPMTVTATYADSKKAHVVLSDGSIVFGWTINVAYLFKSEIARGIVIGKLKPNGVLDSSFGINGYFFYFQAESNRLHSLQLEPDGKLLITGATHPGFYTTIMRLQSTGDFDSSFGNNGVTILTGNDNGINHAVRRSDGKYWIATTLLQNDFKVVTFLLNSNGTKDVAYGTKYHHVLDSIETLDLSLDNNGKLTIFATKVVNPDTTLVALKLLSNGTPDPTYGSNGYYIFPGAIPSRQLLKSIPVANGKSLLLVRRIDDSSHLYRVKPDGGLDSTFGTNGRVTIKNDADQPRAFDMYLRNDSIVLVSAHSNTSASSNLIAYKQSGKIDSTFGVLGIYSNPTGGYINGNATRTFSWVEPPNITTAFRYINYDGTLNTSYGTAGVANVVFTGTSETLGGAGKQSDGKIVIGGTFRSLNTTHDPQGAYLKRYLADGSPDMSFGINGIVESTDSLMEGIEDLIVLPDNKILASAGRVIRKFKANGIVDSTFGTNGVFNIHKAYPFLNTSSFINTAILRIAVQNDGKIVFSGFTFPAGRNELIAGRLSPNGIPDQGFANAGLFRYSSTGENIQARTLTITADQKLLIAGRRWINSPDYYAEVLKLKGDGTLDSAFGLNGKLNYSEISINKKIKPNDLQLLPDNSFLLLITRGNRGSGAGSPYNTSSILHYSATGVRNMSYGVGGMASVTGTGYKIDVRPDGKVVYASLRSRDLNNPSVQVLGLSRVNASGKPDSTFGLNGHETFRRFNLVTSDWYPNLEEVSNNPVPAILAQYDSTTYLLGGTMTFRRRDAVLQKVSISDNMPAAELILLDTLASATCNPVQFFWRTRNENGSQQFIIERSIDGANFNVIAALSAGGVTSGPTTYNYSYTAPDSLFAFYRIKMTGIETVMFSNVVTRTLSAPAAPVISATSTTFCPGNSVSLQASGSGIQWYMNDVMISGATSSTYIATNAGIYSARVLATGCNSAMSNIITVTAASLPSADAGNDTSICAGSSVVLGSTSVTGNSYSWSPNTALSAPNVAQPVASPASNTSYTVTVTNTSGCIDKDSVLVSVKPLPPAPVATQTGSLLTSSAPTGNQWYLGGVAITGAVHQNHTAATNGIYTVIVTINGCSSLPSNQVNYVATSIFDPQLDRSFLIYPNPIIDKLNIFNHSNRLIRYQISDAIGHLISEIISKEIQLQVPMKNLASGIYLLRIQDVKTGKITVRRIMKL